MTKPSDLSNPPLTSNITDTAIIFEGGGMRGAYTAGIVTSLLEAGIHADYVAGISAGSSNTVNYLSRDTTRAKACFVDFAADRRFGSWWTWLQGKGLFNSHYIYEETSAPGQALPFDFATFLSNPARCRIGAFDAVAGETIYWSENDIADLPDLMRRVRASSSMPIIMPPVTINQRVWVDGALGRGGGIPLAPAQADGFTKFFVVLTRPRTYVKPPYGAKPLINAFYHRYPAVVEGIMGRAEQYNATRQELFELERQGRACLVFPDQMSVENGTRDVPALQATYDAARAQAVRELPRWKEFLMSPS